MFNTIFPDVWIDSGGVPSTRALETLRCLAQGTMPHVWRFKLHHVLAVRLSPWEMCPKVITLRGWGVRHLDNKFWRCLHPVFDSVVITHVCPCLHWTIMLRNIPNLQAPISLCTVPGSCWNLGWCAAYGFKTNGTFASFPDAWLPQFSFIIVHDSTGMQVMGARLAGLNDPLADVAELSQIDRDRLHSAISNAQLSCSAVPDIVMPWNLPGLSLVQGDEGETIFPSVPTVPGYVEPVPDHSTQDRPSIPVRTKATAFEHAIAFDSRRVVHLDDDEQFRLLVQKWEAMLSINYHAFDLGVEISGLSQEERLRAVNEVLGGKAVATIRQRLAQLGKYVKWATGNAKRPPFPVTAELIKNHIRHLRNESATYSKLVGFHEVMKFSKHVMGLECDVTAFETAWVNGIFRLAGQNRPLRKQSNVLTVSALQFLEAELDNENLALVDRYAIGVILFTTYSRARFGDLRKISTVILDEASSMGSDCLGYIEMNSASHKMRANGNRLGAHLPLVAPIKGLGKAACGKTFISLTTKVGLNLATWCPLCPLLPAPNLMGDWTGRATTSGEINKWIVQLLAGSGFDTTGFSPTWM